MTEVNFFTPKNLHSHLTERERATLDLVLQGLPNREIGNRLGICESTTKIHVKNLMVKFEASNRTELAYIIETQRRVLAAIDLRNEVLEEAAKIAENVLILAEAERAFQQGFAEAREKIAAKIRALISENLQ